MQKEQLYKLSFGLVSQMKFDIKFCLSISYSVNVKILGQYRDSLTWAAYENKYRVSQPKLGFAPRGLKMSFRQKLGKFRKIQEQAWVALTL